LSNLVKKSQDVVKKGKGIDLSKLESADIQKVFTSFINAKKEYEMTREQERTKRALIDTDLQKYLTKVDQTKEVLSKHLTEQYSIRRETINELFNVLDRAIEEDKDTVAVQVLTALEGIIKESPLKEVEQIGKAFSSDGELEL
jgi:hypothetical protein